MLTEQSSASWESATLTEEKEEEDEEERKKGSHLITCCSTVTQAALASSSSPSPSPSLPASSAPPDLPVCAKNISLTASGEKVILWTR